MNKHIEEMIEEVMTELKVDSSFRFPEHVQEKVRIALTSIYQRGREDIMREIKEFCANPPDEYKDILLNQIEVFEGLETIDKSPL